jgi:hypothetical protein
MALARQTAIIFALACGPAGAAQPLTAEFDIPYELRVLTGGAVMEVSGSFSWALPQNFQAVLASAPQVRVIRLESPGGHVQAAMQVAEIIRQHNLDTYVGRFCASACTLAFLAGHQRWLAPHARLGFHQASAPGFPPALANSLLRGAYEQFGLAKPVVSHALRTPPEELWEPSADELSAAGITTSAAPAAVVAIDDGKSLNLREITRFLAAATDRALVQFTMALSNFLAQLEEVNPETCWAFAHDGSADLGRLLPPKALDALTAAEQRVIETASTAPTAPLSTEERKHATAELSRTMRANGQAGVLEGLRPGAEHAAFCSSLRNVLQIALALPDPQRIRDLRAVLSGE